MSNFTVTLKQLRENKACINGYNKVVCALKKVPFIERDTHIRFEHDEPISLTFVLESNDLDDALWCLRCNDKEWVRDSRLFAVWCARQVEHLMSDERSIAALNVAENYANGLASESKLDAAWDAARAAAWDAARAAARDATWDAASDAAWDAARPAAWDAARDAAWSAARVAARDDAWHAAWSAARAAQKEMFIKMCNGEAPWQSKGG